MSGEVCPSCHRPESVEAAVRDDVAALSDLTGAQPSLAATAVAIAAALDRAEERNVAALAKELRATMAQLVGARTEVGDDGDLGDLDAAG